MKRLLLVVALILGSVSVYATNGDNMIGIGPISRGMGGVGIGIGVGPESALKNPAFMGHDKNFEMLFSGTYFAPAVEVQNQTAGTTYKSFESASDTFMIPAIGFVSKITDNFSFGLGAYGTSGLGVDYRDTGITDGLSRMSTALTIMKFAPAVSYKLGNLGIGFGVPLMYGSLGISYDTAYALGNGPAPSTATGSQVGAQGAGTSDDLGAGFDLGLSYKFKDFNFGVNYQSRISMNYAHQIQDAAGDFGLGSYITHDKLDQPAEYGLGVSYVTDKMTVALDYKIVKWESADGYKEFGWEDQNVIAFGFGYNFGKSVVRIGYNHASSPLGDKAINKAITAADSPINVFNAIGFPATVETHITLGYGYAVSNSFNIDASYVHVPEEETTSLGMSGMTPLKLKHSQKSLSFGGTWTY